MSSTPAGSLWTEKLKQADQFRSERDDGWLAAAIASDCHFKGEFHHTNHSGRPITKNKQFAATRTIHAAVVPKNVRIEVKPTRPMDSGPAALMETLLNWNIHVADLKEVMDFVELDGQVKGVGISFVSWREVAAPEDVDGEAGLTDKQGEADESLYDALAAAMPHRLSHANMARVFHIDPYDFLIDPLATKMEDARWAAHRMWMTKRELDDWRKAGFLEAKQLNYSQLLPSSQRFSREGKEDKNASEIAAKGSVSDSLPLSDEDHDDFVKWEIWQVFDFRKGEVLWVIPGMRQPARKPRPNPFGNPYQDYRPNRTGDEFWSKPDSWIYAPAQLRLDQVIDSMAQLTNAMAKPAWILPLEDCDEFDADILANAQPGEILKLPRAILGQMKRVNEDFRVPDAMIQLQGSLENVVTETSAVSEIASGSLGGAGVTATAANLSAGSQSLRSGYNRRVLDRWVNEVARRIAFMLQKFFTQEAAIPVLGSKAAEWGQPVSPESVAIKNEQIQGTFDFQVHAGDEAREVQVEQRKMAMDLLQIVAPMAATGQVQVDMGRIMMWVFEQMGLPTDLVQQQAPPPIQPQLQQPGAPASRPVSGGPNSGTPTDSQGVPNPDALNRHRTPSAAAIGGAERRV